MIDTNKYEWDSKCRMVVIDGELYQRGSNGDYHLSLYDKSVAQLIADAPLLLEEVKRLREVAYNKDMQVGESDREIKRLREALRIERRIVQAFYDYRDARCYEDCETWMLENGHRVMVKYGDEEQSEWKVVVK